MNIYNLFNAKYPQNYIVRKPFVGFLILLLFSFLFVTIYRPLNAHESEALNYAETMAVYSLSSALSALLFILILKKIPFLSRREKWTLGKEIIAILFIVFGMGTSIYFMAFLLEPPADRWNLATILNSYLNAFLVAVLPLAFFSLVNIQYLINYKELQYGEQSHNGSTEDAKNKKILIKSKLKKEELEFFPSQFLYAESDGNYVDFNIIREGKIIKKTIRNSISNVEMQLSGVPSMLRVHRAYIVNLEMIKSRKGNTAGFRLTLKNGDKEIPVSRYNTSIFERVYKNYTG